MMSLRGQVMLLQQLQLLVMQLMGPCDHLQQRTKRWGHQQVMRLQ